MVGNKCDLEHTIDNFYGYADTSAKEGIGIDNIFYEISELLVRVKGKKKETKCKIIKHEKKKERMPFMHTRRLILI